MSLFLHQTFILVLEELRDLVGRRRAVLSILLYLGIILFALWGFSKIQAALGPTFDFSRFSSEDQSLINQKLEEGGIGRVAAVVLQVSTLPQALWIFQLFTIIWFPVFVSLVSCDMVAIDRYRGTLRFVLLRTSRMAYYFAKMLAHVSLYALLQGLSLAAVVLVSAWTFADFKWGTFLSIAFKYFLLFLPFLWCLVAATQWVSSWSKKPVNALVRVHLLWTFFLLIMIKWPAFTPFYWKISIGLIAPFEGYAAAAALGMSLWAAAFTLLGLVGFLHRDV